MVARQLFKIDEKNIKLFMNFQTNHWGRFVLNSRALKFVRIKSFFKWSKWNIAEMCSELWTSLKSGSQWQSGLASFQLILTAFPHFHCLVHTSRGHERMSLVEIEWRAEMRMSIKSFGTSPIPGIPNPDSLVVGGRNDVLSMGMENNPSYPVIMTFQSDQAYTSTDVPYL